MEGNLSLSLVALSLSIGETVQGQAIPIAPHIHKFSSIPLSIWPSRASICVIIQSVSATSITLSVQSRSVRWPTHPSRRPTSSFLVPPGCQYIIQSSYSCCFFDINLSLTSVTTGLKPDISYQQDPPYRHRVINTLTLGIDRIE